MEYQFKQAIRIKGHRFTVGVCDVPAEVEQHPHFEKYVKAGLVADAADLPKPTRGDSFADRSARLAKRLAKGKEEAKPEQVHEGVQEEEKPKAKRGGAKKKSDDSVPEQEE